MSVTDLAAVDTLASIRARLFFSGAVRQASTTSDTDTVEILATFTCVSSGIWKTEVETSSIVAGAAVGTCGKEKGQNAIDFRITPQNWLMRTGMSRFLFKKN